MTEDSEDQYKPKLQADGGQGPRPPRPTAISTGGPDDYWRGRKNLRYDLATQTQSSWPIPELAFVSLAHCDTPTSYFRIEDVLSGLHRQFVNLAFLVLASKTERNDYLGLSTPAPNLDGASEFKYCQPDLEYCQTNFLQDAYVGTPIYRSSVLKNLSQQSNFVGCLKGVPATNHSYSQIDALLSDLAGENFGILTLAAPIPRARLVLEDGPLAYESRDLWQTCIYYFAQTQEVFERLQSTLISRYAHQTPLMNCISGGLKSYLWSLSLPLERTLGAKPKTLDGYKYLTPLDNQQLSIFCAVPQDRQIKGDCFDV